MTVPRVLGDGVVGRRLVVRLAENVGAAGLAAPNSADDGFDLVDFRETYGGKFDTEQARLVVSKVGGTDVTVASVTQHRMLASREEGDDLDVWDATDTAWSSAGSGSDLEESTGVKILHRPVTASGAELPGLCLAGLDKFDRVAVSVGVVGGTDTPVVNVDAIFEMWNPPPVKQTGAD